MSAPTLPGAQQAGPSSSTLLPAAPATQRAREIQEALKSIVLQTASTLRAKTQLERLQSSVPTSSGSAAASVNESSSSLDKLQGECARYLSLVHGLRDYLLHAQAAIEIELEAATQREAEEAKKTALAAEQALIRQQAAEEEARKKAQEEAERKRVEDEGKAKNAFAAGDKKDAAGEGAQGAEGKKEQVGDDSLSGLATPPLPAAPTDDAVKVETGASAQAKKEDPGKAANDAIIIDSDGDDDEDDVPLAFAPKAGANDNASKPIDLTDSPTLPNAANPLQSTAASQPADASNTTTSDGTTQDPPITSSLPAEAPAAAVGIPGLDLSAFGINLSSLTNLPDLSSLGIPSLTSATSNSNTSSADPTSLAPARDFAKLEKMMGIDLSSATASSSANPTTSTSTTGIPDLSSLGNFNLGSSSGGFGEDTDMFGTSNSGLDLSNFDFSSLTGGAGGADAGASGGVDLSSFLTNFTSNNSGDGGDGTAGS
ncbi:uncharacterized protein UTRI_02125_B [Ustilago trichophora]|uniref:Uncharacterized protein n=1 Tax=Ustilago trichophora TaxID=86804 RepID=A0A5C3DWT6_9BASI|nr:uncharacterized protein UTRI_02125_B [Ustilago trichophora]